MRFTTFLENIDRLSLDNLSQRTFDELIEDTENPYTLRVHAGKYLLIHVIQDLFVRSPLNNEAWINNLLKDSPTPVEHPKLSSGFPLLLELAYDKTAKRLYARIVFEWYDLADQEKPDIRRVFSFEIDPNNTHAVKRNSFGTSDINLTEFSRALDINKWANTLMHQQTFPKP